MARTFFGPFNEQNSTYAEPAGGNTGRWGLGETLILPDERTYRFVRNDGTVEVAGNLYQSIVPIADHSNRSADVVRAAAVGLGSAMTTSGAVAISATLGATLAAVDEYTEGFVHINAGSSAGLGTGYRIRRARATGDSHAAAAASAVLTVNLEPGENVQVALVVTTSKVTFTHSRFQKIIITAAPPSAGYVGISPGVAAANRYYWSQTKGLAAVLDTGTIVVGDSCVGITAAGAGGVPTTYATDGPGIGQVVYYNATAEYAVIDLRID